MLRFTAEEYRGRTPVGYPTVIDAPERGVVGIELDPSFALHFMTDGQQVFAEMYRRAARNDARSSASRQKHGGLPFNDRRPIEASISDQALRNLIGELMAHWNSQPGIIHITDS